MDGREYAGARVFVTGATGLIGSHLVRTLLERGAQVHAFLIPEPEPASQLVRSGDVERVMVHCGRLEQAATVHAAVAAARPEIIFHLGAQTLVGRAREDPVGTFETNIAGTWTLLEACRRLPTAPRAITVASSDKAYGTSDHLPYVETDPLAGEEPYEASKAVTDILARTYAVAYELPTRIARCGNVYGPGDLNWSRLIPGTIRSLLRGERPVVRSDGTPLRDYVHVGDVVAAYLALGAAPLPPGEAFNLSSSERRTVLEVVALVCEVAGIHRQPVILNEARGEIPVQYLDASKAQRVLGWSAQRRLRESLPQVVAWYRSLLCG